MLIRSSRYDVVVAMGGICCDEVVAGYPLGRAKLIKPMRGRALDEMGHEQGRRPGDLPAGTAGLSSCPGTSSSGAGFDVFCSRTVQDFAFFFIEP